MDERPARLLALLRAFLRESRLPEPPGGLTLDTRLEIELGLDSLSRAELIARIAADLGSRLPESALLAATPRELLALAAAGPAVPSAGGVSIPAPAGADSGAPDHPAAAATLLDVLDWHRVRHGERTHLILYDGDDRPWPLDFAALAQGAGRVARRLRDSGLRAGDRVAVMLPTGLDYFFSFFGILAAGGVPVPIYPPARPQQLGDHLRRHARLLDNAGATRLITVPEAHAVARALRLGVPTLRGVITLDGLDGLDAPEPLTDWARPRADDLALLQYTSGSTGDPKGVMLSHAELLANIRAMGIAIAIRADDVFVSWLPLYHDMGLIGAWLGSLYYAIPLILMSPLTFLAHPARWLQAISRHRGTLSAAPNFAYELCLNRLSAAQLAGLDLSSWRLACNGAEPVSPATLRRFAARFAACGLRPEALAPVYGLAEAAVGLAFPPPGRGFRIDRIDRARFAAMRQALPLPAAVGAAEPEILEVVACGQPLPGYRVRVVDDADRERPERHEGRLQFQGPSATRGYHRHPTATAALIRDGWHETGDRAYLADGELYLTGRTKDLIIRGGRNFYPYEVEQALGALPGVRRGCVAAFAVPDPRQGSERLVIVAETKEGDPARRAALQQRLRAVATELLGLPPDEILLAPPHAVLKTSSGKLRRGDTRDRYLSGRLAARDRRPVWQLARAVTAGLPRRARALGRALAGWGYGLWAWGVLLLLAPAVWLGVLTLPRPRWRWRLARGALGLLRRATGVGLEVVGAERLPPAGQAAVLVANHASYLDGFALVAALAQPAGFVAKRELADWAPLRWALTRFGVYFVARFDPHAGEAAAARLVAALRAGERLIWFPEGTFRDRPGLLPFRMGAFAAAAQAGAPLVPIALLGTRACLTGDDWRPRPGRIRVLVGAPLMPDGPDWASASALRESARAWIQSLVETDCTESG